VGDLGLVSRWVMPFSRQIRSNSTSAGRGLPNRPVNCLPLNVRQDLTGNAELPQRGGERQADGPPGGPGHDRCDDAVPGMVIDAGDDLGLGAAGQERPADDVQLPQRHRLIPLPPPVAAPGPLARLRLDQAVPDQHPVDAHPRRRWHHALARQLVRQPQRTPPGMIPPQLTDHCLDLGADLVRARLRPPGPVRQGPQPAFVIPADPGMHALP
jgi:hypothetical protein